MAPALTGFIAHATGSFEFAFAIAGFVLLLGIACYWLLIPKMEPVIANEPLPFLTPVRHRSPQSDSNGDPTPGALPAKFPTKPSQPIR